MQLPTKNMCPKDSASMINSCFEREPQTILDSPRMSGTNGRDSALRLKLKTTGAMIWNTVEITDMQCFAAYVASPPSLSNGLTPFRGRCLCASLSFATVLYMSTTPMEQRTPNTTALTVPHILTYPNSKEKGLTCV